MGLEGRGGPHAGSQGFLSKAPSRDLEARLADQGQPLTFRGAYRVFRLASSCCCPWGNSWRDPRGSVSLEDPGTHAMRGGSVRAGAHRGGYDL